MKKEKEESNKKKEKEVKTTWTGAIVFFGTVVIIGVLVWYVFLKEPANIVDLIPPSDEPFYVQNGRSFDIYYDITVTETACNPYVSLSSESCFTLDISEDGGVGHNETGLYVGTISPQARRTFFFPVRVSTDCPEGDYEPVLSASCLGETSQRTVRVHVIVLD